MGQGSARSFARYGGRTADGKPGDGAEWCQSDIESHFGSDYDKTDNSTLPKHARQMQTWLSYVAQLVDLLKEMNKKDQAIFFLGNVF